MILTPGIDFLYLDPNLLKAVPAVPYDEVSLFTLTDDMEQRWGEVSPSIEDSLKLARSIRVFADEVYLSLLKEADLYGGEVHRDRSRQTL